MQNEKAGEAMAVGGEKKGGMNSRADLNLPIAVWLCCLVILLT